MYLINIYDINIIYTANISFQKCMITKEIDKNIRQGHAVNYQIPKYNKNIWKH